MIELRWIKQKVGWFGAAEAVLQSRHFVVEYHALLREPLIDATEWTEWKDVPFVEEK